MLLLYDLFYVGDSTYDDRIYTRVDVGKVKLSS